MVRKRTGDSAAALRRAGFAATVVLALAAWLLSVVQVERARHEVRTLAGTADRSTFLVGEVGRHVSRLRAAVLERLVSHGAGRSSREEAHAVAARLDGTIRELEPLLLPDEHERWADFLPLLARFRHDADAALAATHRGEVAHARSIVLEDMNPLVVALQARLDELGAMNARSSAELLAAADGTLGRVVVIESVLGLGLLLGLAAVWWTVLGTLARQRRAVDQYVERIETSNRDLDAFAGRIAHDLRNAIAPVGFAAGALRHGANRPDAVARIAGQLQRTVQRIDGLIEGLLAFSRMGGAEPPASANVAATVRSVVEELAPLASRVDATLEVRLGDATVACPPGLLHVVVANLVGNAVKFLVSRPVRRVTVTTSTVDGRWGELVVADTGPGIPRDSLSRIFEPLYRVPGTAVEGTGIGLATVRRIVAAHGGTIAVDSDVGRGAEFRVRLPLREAARTHGADASA